MDFPGRTGFWVNVETHAAALLAHLRKANTAVYDEIAAAQKAIGAPG